MKQFSSSLSSRFNYKGFNLFFTFLAFFLFASIFAFPLQNGDCSQVTLTWDPNTEPDLAGYEIYYGTASGNYPWNINIGNVTTYTLNNLNIGVTYYVAATAYNTQGLQSGFSNEVVYTVPSCAYTISPSSASFSASGGSGSVLVTTQAGCNWGTSAGIPWITVTTGSGMGSGTMGYTVSPNTGASRTASLTIAGNVFTINEAGLPTYAITASAGTGGTISPSGQVSILSGAGQTFTITPNTGYSVADVAVDGISQGSITSYTFSSVSANHTITASFSLISSTTYSLSVSNNGTGNGSVSVNPTGTTFPAGTQVTLTASPDNNSVFSSWSGACSGTTTTCQVTLNSNLSVAARFNLKTYKIASSIGIGGSISPSGEVSVQSGANQTFIITPDAGYKIVDVTIDGVSQGAITSFSFTDVSSNHTITATFTLLNNETYILKISKSGTGDGSVSLDPAGTIFAAGTQVNLNAAPDINSIFSSWSGACSGTESTCQVTMNSNLSVSVNFSAVSNTPIVATGNATLMTMRSATLNGTVNPYGLSTTYYFEWGQTTSYGNTTGTQEAGSDKSNIAVSAKLTDLTPNSIYHYRLVATNAEGTTKGEDATFVAQLTGKVDFNSDRKTDILWRNKVNGDVAVWFMNGTTLISGEGIYGGVPLDWEIAGTGDFNNDGKPDILWRNKVSGDVAVWYMDGTTLISGAVFYQGVPLAWEIVGTGDFNNDGKPDLLWRNKVNGDVAVWYMDGTTLISGAVFYQGVPLAWEIVGTGDFNNDGKPDLLWRNKVNGDVAVWYMDGTTLISGAVFYQGVPLSWEIVGTGDFNNEGKTDLLWRNKVSGDISVWHMNDSNLINGIYIYQGVPLEWEPIAR